MPQETEASSLIYTTGCIESLTNWINNNLHIVGGLAFGLAVIQVRGRSFLFLCSGAAKSLGWGGGRGD